ncbi:sugar kinase [Flagellimonas myxillae]|uniref:sugar kinase n=1 Tax=Flagellimonas myxillae TaxID=2942214 RepID=UPI00201FB22C|nr:sugar kinase [Muricauda myxillae]MCL6267916.1 sugar kinase [Muricauda myxillae]
MMGFVTFGEIMLRLTPVVKGNKLLTSSEFTVGYAGAESNVAVSLACLKNQVDFISKVPNNPLGQASLLNLKRFGVSTDEVVLGGMRMGTYFIELGASIRPSRVVYDREGSAISQITEGELDWAGILKNKKWLHLSGITPALSEQCAKETVLAAKTAQKMDVKVSFDLNFRRSLWPDGKTAKAIFDQIIPCSDTVFANLGVLEDVYGLKFPGSDVVDSTKAAIEKASKLFNVGNLAFTIREHPSASQNRLHGMAMHNGKIVGSRAYNVEVEDRFGTGDAFAAAYLHALDKAWEIDQAIGFATAAFALKHTIKGDLHTSSEEEIFSIMDGNLSGHVIR